MEQENSGFLATHQFTVVVSKSPTIAPIIQHFDVGTSLEEVFHSTGFCREQTSIVLNGSETVDWAYVPSQDDHILVNQTPNDGIILSTVAGIYATREIYYQLGKLFRHEQDSVGDSEDNRIRGSRNEIGKYKPVPVVLGKRRITPPYAALPYSYWDGETQYYKILLCAGYGPLKIEDIRIGDVSIDEFENAEKAVLDWYSSSHLLQLNAIKRIWSDDVIQTAVNEQLPRATVIGNVLTTTETTPLIAETPAGDGDVSLSFVWPRGAHRFNENGKRGSLGGSIMITYEDNDGNWLCPAEFGTAAQFNDNGSLPYQIWSNSAKTEFFIYTNEFIREDNFNHGGRKKTSSRLKDITSYVEQVDESKNIVTLNYSDMLSSADPELRTISSLTTFMNTEQLVQKELKFTPENTGTNPIVLRLKNLTPKAAVPDQGAPYSQWFADVELFTVSRINSLNFERLYDIIGLGDRFVYPDFRPVIVAIDIKSSDQLSGTLDNINMLATTVVPQVTSNDWSDDWSGWWEKRNDFTFVTTEHPPAIYKWLLQGPSNAKQIGIDKIDTDALAAWSTNCTDKGWRCSEYLDYEMAFKNLLNNVAMTGRAQFSMRNGKFSVVESVKKTIPTQLFTPKNSRDFTSKRTFPEKFDGIEFEFFNEAEGYEKDLGQFYDPQVPVDQRDGTFDKLTLWGIPSGKLATEHARFALLEEKLRRETYELTTDIEGLVADRGDMVRIANDIIDVGLGQGFITAKSGDDFSIDEVKDLTIGEVYAIQVRTVSSGTKFRTFNAEYLGGGDWTSTTTAPSFSVGDLAVYGQSGLEVLDAIVVSVKYNDDYEATLTLQNAANILFDYDGGPIPPYETNLTQRTENKVPSTPVIKATSAASLTTEPFATITVTNTNKLVATTKFVRVQYASSTEFEETENPDTDPTLLWQTVATQTVEQSVFRIPLSISTGVKHYFRAQALGSGNLSSAWSNVATINVESDSVDDVENVVSNELKNFPPTSGGFYNTLFVTFTPPNDPDWGSAIVEYKKQNETRFKEMFSNSTESQGGATATFSADGTTYDVRIRSVSIKGVPNDDGVEFTYKTTNTLDPEVGEDDKPETNLLVPNVTGLELFEQGNDTDFTGKHAKFSWNKTTAEEWSNLGNEGLKGASRNPLSEYFRDYEVTIYDPSDGSTRRTEYVTDNFYTYTWEKNREDSIRLEQDSPLRQFGISVVMRSRQNGRSATPDTLVVQNPAPDSPVLVISPGYSFINIKYNQPTDPDWIGTKFWISETDGFTPDEEDPSFNGPDTTLNLSGLDAGTTYYLRWQPYDAFGPGDMVDQFETATVRLNSRDLDETPPTVPTNLNITTGVLDSKLYTQSWVTLTWDESTDPDDGIVAGYYVERWDSVDSTKIQTGVASLTHTITGAVPGRTYYMRVAAQDWAGNISDFSATESIVAAGDVDAPSGATSITATNGLDKVIIKWTNPSDLDFLAAKIYRGSTSGFTPNDSTNLLATVAGEPDKSNTLVDAEVTNGDDYYYKIVTVDVSGNESSASTAAGPATPFKLDATNFENYFEEAAINNAYINTLDASKITAGDIAAARMSTNFLSTAQATIGTLSAITANVGTLTGGTIQGVTVKTQDLSGINSQVIMDTNGVHGYNSSGTLTFEIKTDGSGQLGAGSNYISWNPSGTLSVPGTLVAGDIVGNTIKTASTGWRVELKPTGLFYTNGTTTTVAIQDAGHFQFGTGSNYISWNGTTFTVATDRIGSGTATPGTSSVSLGSNSSATGNNAVAVGQNATANANDSVAVGRSTTATTQSVVVGYNSTAYHNQVTVMGQGAYAYGAASVAIGYLAKANTDTVNGAFVSSVAIGHLAETHRNSVAIGQQSDASVSYSIAIGSGANAGTNSYATALGTLSTASGARTTALGYNTTASGSASIAIGDGSSATNISNMAIGDGASTAAIGGIAIGFNTTATQSYNLAVGYGADATGNNSATALGNNTTASGNATVAVGTSASASGNVDVAVGESANASGGLGVAVGASSDATQAYCVAVGYNAQATGNNGAVAIGPNTTASAGLSMALGPSTTSTTASTIVIGNGSHATNIPGSLTVTGSKTFQIPHPTKENFHLRHGAYEGPVSGGNIYRYQIETTDNVTTIDLPDYFSAINKDIQVFVTPEKHFGAAYGEIVGNTCTITSNQDGKYNVLIMGTRNDPAVKDWNIFGAEVPMTDNEIEQKLAEEEEREPVFVDHDAYTKQTDRTVLQKTERWLQKKSEQAEKLNKLVQRRQKIKAEKD